MIHFGLFNQCIQYEYAIHCSSIFSEAILFFRKYIIFCAQFFNLVFKIVVNIFEIQFNKVIPL